MKPFVLILSLLNVLLGIGQTTSSLPNTNTAIPKFKTNTVASIGDNGFKFNVRKTGGNSKFSEFGSGIFKGKFIMVSSKKIGGLAKVDKTTREANKELYCLEVDEDGELSDPLFFSRILNTSNSEDQLTFSSDESIVYYTRNSKEKPEEFKIYRATLEPNSHGNWINHERLSINQDGVSIENPFLSPDGQQLYFSSNREDALGGYDIYASRIDKDGKLSTPKNLGNLVNTTHNETHPSLSPDGKKLYFASQGHNNLGGYDIFVSRISQDGVKAPKNLGNTINTAYDELAYFIAKNNIGYISSNKPEGQGSFDVYIALDNTVKQFVKGVVKHSESQTLLPNTTVILKDEEGKELDKQLTDAKGSYVFEITPTKAIIVENVYFDFNKHNVKSESYITLDKIIKVLEDNPNIKLSINAHTDNIDTDAYNLRLASRRAKFILKYLTENNVDRNRLFYKAYGEKHPEIDCKNNCSKKELQANRRVEFLIFN
jgi:outer membrane protein OmpA-like peptidoglycan-associated protein